MDKHYFGTVLMDGQLIYTEECSSPIEHCEAVKYHCYFANKPSVQEKIYNSYPDIEKIHVKVIAFQSMAEAYKYCKENEIIVL